MSYLRLCQLFPIVSGLYLRLASKRLWRFWESLCTHLSLELNGSSVRSHCSASDRCRTVIDHPFPRKTLSVHPNTSVQAQWLSLPASSQFPYVQAFRLSVRLDWGQSLLDGFRLTQFDPMFGNAYPFQVYVPHWFEPWKHSGSPPGIPQLYFLIESHSSNFCLSWFLSLILTL